jgi:adenosylcobinamide-GDP ribazoletransferase
VACGVGIVVATVCLGAAGPIAAAVAGLAAWALSSWAARALGGVSGDVLGAIEQVGEVLTLLVAVAMIARGFGVPFV